MSGNGDKSVHILPSDSPIVYLEATEAFNGLQEKEKLYAYHLANASWIGSLITFVQTSIESPSLFVLLHKLFSVINPTDLKEKAIKAGLTEEEVNAWYVYAAGVFANAGNYKGFGDLKFIPSINEDKVKELLTLSPNWPELEPIWNNIKSLVYDLSGGKHCLGFVPDGCTTYLSKNCTKKDNDIVVKWLKNKNIEGYNNRTKKIEENGKVKYQIVLAGQENGIGSVMSEERDGIIFEIIKGDYSPLMGKVADSLQNASTAAANPNQVEMLKAYCRSFRECSLDAHKDGSRFWVKDKGPAIETYIGFIETYRDPAGIRGEFEGFVAAVNRPMSEKFQVLVDNAEKFLPLLPWSAAFEKDKYLRPDFTSLDVIAFAGSGIPAGINIPNYDEIRQNEGFKNVSLGNVIPASFQLTTIPFLSEQDKELIEKYRVPSFEVQVGIHELLGHGSGKLFRQNEDGSLNFPNITLDPLTGKPIEKYYKVGDSYDSVFGSMGSSFEECRAEAIGLYLSLEEKVLKIFGHVSAEADDIIYVNWLSLVWSGLSSLEVWDPSRGWTQAHSQARFGLMRVLVQAGVVKVEQVSSNDLLLSMNRGAIKGAGRNAIGHFLLQLQVFKATADFDSAEKLYHHYTDVVEPWKTWRNIVLANRRPRKMFAQANLKLEGDNKVVMKNYEASKEGLITSWVERFDEPEVLYEALTEISLSESKNF